MDWLATLVPKRLYVGPSLHKHADATHVVAELHVTHVFNLAADGKSTYVRHWTKAPKVVSVPLPEGDGLHKRNEKAQIQWYTSAARQVADVLEQDETAVVYVHHRSGRAEEATVAMVAWAMVWPAQAPRDLNAWCAENHHELMLDSEDERALTLLAMNQARHVQQNGIGRFFAKKAKK